VKVKVYIERCRRTTCLTRWMC